MQSNNRRVIILAVIALAASILDCGGRTGDPGGSLDAVFARDAVASDAVTQPSAPDGPDSGEDRTADATEDRSAEVFDATSPAPLDGADVELDVASDVFSDRPGPECPNGRVCDGLCVDPTTDPEHCGACGTACGAGASCRGAACVCDQGGLAYCDGNCVDVTSDDRNCGACGAYCNGDAGQTCVTGRCGCSEGLTACGSGCVDTRQDSSNCGTCNTQCASGLSCQGGVCACANGAECPGRPGCINTSTDAENCGSCGHYCDPGQSAPAESAGRNVARDPARPCATANAPT